MTGGLRHSGRRALRRERLGLVFQNPSENLLDDLTVADNLRAAAQSARRTCVPGELSTASADLVLETLRRLAEREFAVLVASHDDRLIELSTRVAWLRDGRVEGIG
ncbi:hypothetical protein [Amycolatopsis acididurans]|uniref:hypothetical protein n=1 Tax=Amycolatopsis acididurans TaxID=2724524 RepID=UPI0035E41EB3